MCRAISQVVTKNKTGTSNKKVKQDTDISVKQGAKKISFSQFRDTVLPDAASMEYKWPQHSDGMLVSILNDMSNDAPVLHKRKSNFRGI